MAVLWSTGTLIVFSKSNGTIGVTGLLRLTISGFSLCNDCYVFCFLSDSDLTTEQNPLKVKCSHLCAAVCLLSSLCDFLNSFFPSIDHKVDLPKDMLTTRPSGSPVTSETSLVFLICFLSRSATNELEMRRQNATVLCY